MINNHLYMSTYSLSRLTYVDVLNQIKKKPYLILPLGGMEPFGVYGGFGINSLCIEALAGAFSQQTEILVAPVVNYSCTTQFKSFQGAIGIKPKVFCSFLSNLCNDSFYQGFEKILILNSIEENTLALELLEKRYNDDQCVKIEIFSLQNDKKVREFVAERKSGVEMGRSEFLMLSMAAFLNSELLHSRMAEKKIVFPNTSTFNTWKKRGRDPEKFRKLFPSGSSSNCAHQYDSLFGNEVFGFILSLLLQRYSPLFENKEINASS